MLTKNRDIHMVNLVDFWLIFAHVIKVKLKCFLSKYGHYSRILSYRYFLGYDFMKNKYNR